MLSVFCSFGSHEVISGASASIILLGCTLGPRALLLFTAGAFKRAAYFYFYFYFYPTSLLLKSSPDPHRVALFPPSKCRSFKRARRKEKKRPEIEGDLDEHSWRTFTCILSCILLTRTHITMTNFQLYRTPTTKAN